MTDALARIHAAFADAGVTGRLHALGTGSGARPDAGAGQPVPTASVRKLCVLVTLHEQFDDVHVAGKTGSLPTLRNEVGVVEYPDGGRYAVAVFTRTAHTAATLPAADAVIGTAARTAVDALRAKGPQWTRCGRKGRGHVGPAPNESG